MSTWIWIALSENPTLQGLDLRAVFEESGVRAWNCSPCGSTDSCTTYTFLVDGRQVLKLKRFLTKPENIVRFKIKGSGTVRNGWFSPWPSKKTSHTTPPANQTEKQNRFTLLRRKLERAGK